MLPFVAPGALDVSGGKTVVHLPIHEHMAQRIDVRGGHAVKRHPHEISSGLQAEAGDDAIVPSAGH